jgi:hypothetical protein
MQISPDRVTIRRKGILTRGCELLDYTCLLELKTASRTDCRTDILDIPGKISPFFLAAPCSSTHHAHRVLKHNTPVTPLRHPAFIEPSIITLADPLLMWSGLT